MRYTCYVHKRGDAYMALAVDDKDFWISGKWCASRIEAQEDLCARLNPAIDRTWPQWDGVRWNLSEEPPQRRVGGAP